MRRALIWLSLLGAACRLLAPLPAATPSPTAEATEFTVFNDPSPSPSPAPAQSPSPGLTETPKAKSGRDFQVRYHPDGGLYIGDLVSLEVIAPEEGDYEKKKLFLSLGDDSGQELGSAEFQPFGIAGRMQATLKWVWDTGGLAPGDYSLVFSVNPDGPQWRAKLLLNPANAIPSSQSRSRWRMAESRCCVAYYISNTAAARDITDLLAIADQRVEHAVSSLGIGFTDPITITLLPRVLGHGGFATDEIYVSYLDRNYAGNDFGQVLHHEMIHLLDSRLDGELRPTILLEGLAVYLARGHFKLEPLMARAAALLELGWYLPLVPLADDFYASQHEVGYLEGGALIQYLVNIYGWEAFSTFYRDIDPHPTGKQSAALDAALLAHFGISLAQLEQNFTAELYRQHLNPDLVADVRLTVTFFETVRRYQQLLDPSAYFLTAWLPSGEEMRSRGIVADYLRHPIEPVNQAIESKLVAADENLRAGDYAEVERLLDEVNIVLDEEQNLRTALHGYPDGLEDAAPTRGSISYVKIISSADQPRAGEE
ncbi:MAG TPA: hypothetical protein VJ436_15105 [Anaerolineales bacterium]|nr:hypothetical protein [Anaerolineales bacterium]